MAVASLTDVQIALGRLLSPTMEQDQVEYWLNGIELVIKGRLGDLTALDQDLLKYVETEAAATKVRRNGTLESSISVTVDDSTVTRRYDPISATDITDEWWQLLSPTDDRASSSVRPGFDADLARWPVSTPPWPYGNTPPTQDWWPWPWA